MSTRPRISYGQPNPYGTRWSEREDSSTRGAVESSATSFRGCCRSSETPSDRHPRSALPVRGRTGHYPNAWGASMVAVDAGRLLDGLCVDLGFCLRPEE